MVKLSQLAKTIRSKNAGPDLITFDIMFGDEKVFREVTSSGALTAERIAELFGIERERIVHFDAFEPALAVKVAIRRFRPSGSPGETDVMGSQMYAPLLELEVPVSAALRERLAA